MAQRADRLERLPQRVLPGCGDREIELALAAALGRLFTLAGFDEAFFLQSVEARINAAGRGLPTGACLDVVLNRHPVSVGVQSDDGEQQVLLQGRQFCITHNFVLMEEISRMQGAANDFP